MRRSVALAPWPEEASGSQEMRNKALGSFPCTTQHHEETGPGGPGSWFRAGKRCSPGSWAHWTTLARGLVRPVAALGKEPVAQGGRRMLSDLDEDAGS